MAAPAPHIGPTGYIEHQVVTRSDQSTLYRATRARDRVPVLLKVWRTPCLAQNLGQFYHERTILVRLRDSLSAPTLLDASQDVTSPHLVFADFEAKSQQTLPLPLPLGSFLELASACAKALRDLHNHCVVHKNIRPANLLRDTTTGAIKLINFEIASWLSESHQGAARQGMVEGALAYMAPEQTGRLTLPIDFRADLYALGCTLYEWLTGHPPFTAQNTLAWIRLHLAENPTPPVRLRKDVPASVDAIILKLLEKMPDDRYQSAAGLAHDLEVCAAQWTRCATVVDFALATQDVPDRFFLPQRLYGRQAQADVLKNALHAAQQQVAPQVVLLHGEAGVGKTSLIERLYKPLVRARGYFISGKFDPYEQNKPYAGLSSALADLVQQVLTEPPEILTPWQQSVRQNLGSKAALLIDLVPGIELLLDSASMPPLPTMDAGESRQARHVALKQFIAVFASASHPLVIFLDDLQWSDGASLDLLVEVATSLAVALVLTFAYRSNEIDTAHPVHSMLTQLLAAQANMQEIDLPPLDASALTALVQESTGATSMDAAELAMVVQQKTLGNPFFAREFLLCLWKQNILFRKAQSWHWDRTRVANLNVSVNLADMLSRRLLALTEPTQRLLFAASCLGSNVDIATLALAMDAAPQALEESMQDAVQHLLMMPLPRIGATQNYRFAHDRIKQAAAHLCNTQTAQLVHMRVGLNLLAQLPEAPNIRQIFTTVNHLNAARSRLQDAGVMAHLRDLNLAAGFAAKAACAFSAAQNYLTCGLAEGVPGGDFEARLALAEIQYAQHDTAATEATLAMLLQQQTWPAHRARTCALWLRMLRSSERSGEAVEKFRTWYEEFVGTLPAETDVFLAIVAEQETLNTHLQGRPPSAFLELPRTTDPMGEALCSLLREAATLLIMTSPPMCLLVALKIITLSIKYGNSPPSCYGYTAYGMALSSVFNDASTGLTFAQVAAQLAEQLHAKRDAAHSLMMLGSINCWKHPADSTVPILERAMHLFGEVGDFEYAGFCALFRSWAFAQRACRGFKSDGSIFLYQEARFGIGSFNVQRND